eukprot:4106899-Prymnesium_polylepis.1
MEHSDGGIAGRMCGGETGRAAVELPWRATGAGAAGATAGAAVALAAGHGAWPMDTLRRDGWTFEVASG